MFSFDFSLFDLLTFILLLITEKKSAFQTISWLRKTFPPNDPTALWNKLVDREKNLWNVKRMKICCVTSYLSCDEIIVVSSLNLEEKVLLVWRESRSLGSDLSLLSLTLYLLDLAYWVSVSFFKQQFCLHFFFTWNPKTTAGSHSTSNNSVVFGFNWIWVSYKKKLIMILWNHSRNKIMRDWRRIEKI